MSDRERKAESVAYACARLLLRNPNLASPLVQECVRVVYAALADPAPVVPPPAPVNPAWICIFGNYHALSVDCDCAPEPPTPSPANQPTPEATHRCKVCHAQWRLNPPTKVQPEGSWSLVYPFLASKCCDNVAMGSQIEVIDRVGGGSPASPSGEAIVKAFETDCGEFGFWQQHYRGRLVSLVDAALEAERQRADKAERETAIARNLAEMATGIVEMQAAKLQAVPVQEDADLDVAVFAATDRIRAWAGVDGGASEPRLWPILRDFANRVREPLEKQVRVLTLERDDARGDVEEFDRQMSGLCPLDHEKSDDHTCFYEIEGAKEEAERKLAEVTQAKRDDEDAACRLEELRVAFGLPEGTSEEIASGINLMLDCKRDFVAEARRDTWEKAIDVAGRAVRDRLYGADFKSGSEESKG